MKHLSKILPALGDAGIGLTVSAVMISWFDAPATFLFVLWVLAWAYLPDLDGAFHFIKTGKAVADLENGRDHREGLHYPLIWTVLFGVLVYFFGINIWLISAYTAIVLHFLHDMIGIGWGVQIFAPLDWGSYKLFSKKWVSADVSLLPLVTRYSRPELRKALMKYGEADWIERYFCKVTHVSIVDYSFFLIGVITIFLAVL
jgi:hypothetical protein